MSFGRAPGRRPSGVHRRTVGLGMDDRELKISPAHVAYRTVFLAAGLLLFGLLFRQLVTLLLAMLMTIIIAIPLAAAAQRLERYRIPRPVGALLALLGGIGTLALIIYLLIPPFVDQTNQFVDDVPGDRPRPRGRLRRRDRPELERGRRQGPELRRALHRPARPADRAAHVDRAERRRHPRRARADPDHRLLHGDPARAARGRAGAARRRRLAASTSASCSAASGSPGSAGWRAWSSTCSSRA